MLSIKLLAHSYNFFKNVLSRHSIKMANIKLGDLYLFKKESKDIIELLTKKILKTIKTNQAMNYIISLKNNLKTRKE